MEKDLYRPVDRLPETCLDYLAQSLELEDGKLHSRMEVLQKFAGVEFVPEDFEADATWETLANPD